MNGDNLLDIIYFLNEDDPFDDLSEEEGFISSESDHHPIVMSIPLSI